DQNETAGQAHEPIVSRLRFLDNPGGQRGCLLEPSLLEAEPGSVKFYGEPLRGPFRDRGAGLDVFLLGQLEAAKSPVAGSNEQLPKPQRTSGPQALIMENGSSCMLQDAPRITIDMDCPARTRELDPGSGHRVVVLDAGGHLLQPP